MGLIDKIGGAVGGIVDMASGAVGGVIDDILGGATSGGKGDAMASVANASRDAAIAQSNAQLQIAQTQAATMQLGILKSSQDAQFQNLAWLTDRLDSGDTKLQIAVENAKLHLQEESDHHVEAMQGLKNDARELEIRNADREVA